MATKKVRAWFVDKLKRIGIVEKLTNAITKDGYTTDWGSISEVKDLRIYAISRDTNLSLNSITSTWNQIPEQFHEGIINKVIAGGYKDPRNMELELAQYFDTQYLLDVKEAKKYSKSNYRKTGTIKQQDF